MSYKIDYSSRFKKDYKKICKRGYDITLLEKIIRILADNETIPAYYNPHKLEPKDKGYWECHIQTDWLLI